MRCARSQCAPAQAGQAPAARCQTAAHGKHVALERVARRAPGTRAPTPGCAGAAPARPRSPRPTPAARRTAPPPAARCPARPAAAHARAGHPRRAHRPRPYRRSPDRRPGERGRACARARGRQCGGEPLRRRRSGAIRATRSATGISASRQATCGPARVAPRPQHQVHVRRGAARRQHRSVFFFFGFKNRSMPSSRGGHAQVAPLAGPTLTHTCRSAPPSLGPSPPGASSC